MRNMIPDVELNAERLLLPREVARLFRVDLQTVTRWAMAGRLASVRTPGGQRRFRECDVLPYVKAYEAEGVRR